MYPDGRTTRQLMPAWMETLNNILTKLGEEDTLAVTTVAVVVFPGGRLAEEIRTPKCEGRRFPPACLHK